MPFQLVVVKGRSASQTLRIPSEGVTTVGRLQGCQIRIASSQVSRKHCELFEKKGHLLVKDLSSSNGTLVNGKKIEGQQVLEPGNILAIGSVIFRVEAYQPEVAPRAAGRPGDTAVAQPVAVGEAEAQDYEIEADSDTRITVPKGTSARPAAAKTGAAVIPEAKVVAQGADAPAAIELAGEDEVADFLLELEVDDEDKR